MAENDLTPEDYKALRKLQAEGKLSAEEIAKLNRLGRTTPRHPALPDTRATIEGGRDPIAEYIPNRPLGQLAIEEGLPILGGVAGFTLGGMTGNPLMAAGLGAGGAMAGRAQAPGVAEAAGYTPSAPKRESFLGDLGDLALEGGLALGGEAVTRVGVPALTALSRRLTLGVPRLQAHPDAAARVAALDALNIEPTLSDVLAPGASAARREQALAMTPGGAPRIQEVREARANALTGAGERFRQGLGPASTAVERGTGVSAAVEGSLEAMRGAERQAWQQLEQRVGAQTPMANQNLKQAAREILAREQQKDAARQDGGLIAHLTEIIQGPDTVPYRQFHARASDYGSEADRPLLVRSANAADYARLYGAALTDLSAGVRQANAAHGGLFDWARDLTSQRHRLIEGMNINKLRDMDPEQISKLATGRLNTSELTRLREAVLGPGGQTPGGVETWNQVRRAVADDVFSPSPRGAEIRLPGTEVRTLSAKTLRQRWEAIGGREVLFQPHERTAFENILRAAEVMETAARPGHPVGSQTAQALAYQGRTGTVGKMLMRAAGGAAGYLGEGPLAAAGGLFAGGVAADAIATFVQRSAARLLTDPRLARELATPAAQRAITQWAQTGAMPRVIARLIGNTGVRALGSATGIGTSASW